VEGIRGTRHSPLAIRSRGAWGRDTGLPSSGLAPAPSVYSLLCTKNPAFPRRWTRSGVGVPVPYGPAREPFFLHKAGRAAGSAGPPFGPLNGSPPPIFQFLEE
jgi:hypothetical protein